LRHGAIFGVEQLHVLIVSCATGPFLVWSNYMF